MAKKSKKPVSKKSTGNKFVYFFGNGKADGNGQMKDLLGGKGANLAEMTNAGVPVPPGFTITTSVCNEFSKNNNKVPTVVETQMSEYVKKLENTMGAKLGEVSNPLLVSVRSGAKFSMPGMMDTILNLGLNDETVQGLITKTKNERFALDCYRRFIQMFGNVVLEIEKNEFEHLITEKKEEMNIKLDTDLTPGALRDLISKYKKVVKEHSGKDFPQDPKKQLEMARDAVFRSWNNPRAITYRKLNDIPGSLGTAVNIQTMVFGNMGDDSATGVGFTRNPANGEDEFYGEYLTNAQGEDVVAGVRTPNPINELEKEMSTVYKQLRTITSKLEKHYRDVQDFEFTIQKGKLFMLQTRTGKRTTHAAIKIAVDMVKEKLITKKEAILRIDPAQLDQLLHPIIDPKAKLKVIAKGLPASPGAASGIAIFTADEAAKRGEKEKVLLVRNETCPDDIHGMNAAQGILTARGGMTSHAAVVARGMGKCCVAGCEEIKVSEAKKQFTSGSTVVKEGDWVSLNGTTGEVILGQVATIEPELTGDFNEFMKWSDEYRKLGVRANADVPHDAVVARNFGAEGIGLCRTEHMFFAEDRLPLMQKMILAKNEADRRVALAKLLPLQKSDFKGLFKEMKGFPVTIRLLDPPLHEFLPKREELMVEVAVMKAKGEEEEKIAKKEALLARVEELHEFNPMLGHRGCRLGIAYPEITEMQAQAIIEAACELQKEGMKIVPEIMIPLVGNVNELISQKEIVNKIAHETIKRLGVKLDYLVGTMIELPRACVTADEIAKEADFFSFGTNDLTQTTLGFSRDDVVKFLNSYIDKGIFEKDPFTTIDQDGVGALVEMGVKKGRSVNKKLKIGICGEHGGDPASVEFCDKLDLNYVSCSPYRIPIARLAAAQAAIKDKK
ncbi:pyruvate, phosphate dikinase [Candidatus Margulisiibacteriota bacterium]